MFLLALGWLLLWGWVPFTGNGAGYGYVFGFSQDDKEPDITALKKELETATDDDQRLSLLKQLYEATARTDKKQALEFARQALTLTKESGDGNVKGVALRNYALALYSVARYPESLEFHFKALNTAKEIKHTRLTAVSLTSIGNVFLQCSDYEKANDYYGQALEFFRDLKEDANISKIHNNIGVVCFHLGEFDKALEHYFLSLKIKEKIGSKFSVAMTLNNIGIMYKSMGDNEKAMVYHQKSLHLGKELRDNYLIGANLQNMGIILRKQGKYQEALDNYLKALEFKEKLFNPNHVSNLLLEIGTAYRDLEQYPKAMEYFTRTIEMSERSGVKDRVAATYNKIGSIHYLKGQFPEAIDYYQKALAIVKNLKNGEILEETYKRLSQSHASLGEHDKSLHYLKQAQQTTDRLFGKAAVTKFRKIEMEYELNSIKNRMNARKRAELKYYLIFIGLLLVLLTFVALNRYRVKRRALILLEQKNLELEQQRDKLSQMGKKIQELMETTDKKHPRYEGSTLTPKQAKQNLKRLLVAMETDKLYRDPELTTRSLARKLSMTQRDLSRIINEQLNRNFNEFINQYRIHEATGILSGDPGKNGDSISILELAFHVGFNSKSSFNTVFKKVTGKTPSEFKKENRPCES